VLGALGVEIVSARSFRGAGQAEDAGTVQAERAEGAEPARHVENLSACSAPSALKWSPRPFVPGRRGSRGRSDSLNAESAEGAEPARHVENLSACAAPSALKWSARALVPGRRASRGRRDSSNAESAEGAEPARHVENLSVCSVPSALKMVSARARSAVPSKPRTQGRFKRRVRRGRKACTTCGESVRVLRGLGVEIVSARSFRGAEQAEDAGTVQTPSPPRAQSLHDMWRICPRAPRPRR
jgi:hypothetical protein